MTNADGGHWAFASFWAAWQMHETNNETNRSLKCHSTEKKHWLQLFNSGAFACPRVDDYVEMSCA